MFEIGKQYEFNMLEDCEGEKGKIKFFGKIKKYEFPLIALEDTHLSKNFLDNKFSDEILHTKKHKNLKIQK